jgi:hypothetical protein
VHAFNAHHFVGECISQLTPFDCTLQLLLLGLGQPCLYSTSAVLFMP